MYFNIFYLWNIFIFLEILMDIYKNYLNNNYYNLIIIILIRFEKKYIYIFKYLFL